MERTSQHQLIIARFWSIIKDKAFKQNALNVESFIKILQEDTYIPEQTPREKTGTKHTSGTITMTTTETKLEATSMRLTNTEIRLHTLWKHELNFLYTTNHPTV